MKKKTLDLIDKVRNKYDGSVLSELVRSEDELGDMKNVKHVCSVDEDYAISPDEFMLKASQASSDYPGFKYEGVLPYDLMLIHEDGTLNLVTIESECVEVWLTVPVYDNGPEFISAAEKLDADQREALDRILDEPLDQVVGAGIWRETDDTDPEAEEGPVDPEDLVRFMEGDGCNYVIDYKDGYKSVVLPDGLQGNATYFLADGPNEDAKPFEPFHDDVDLLSCGGDGA